MKLKITGLNNIAKKVERAKMQVKGQSRKALISFGKEVAGSRPGTSTARGGFIQREMTDGRKSGRTYTQTVGIGGRRRRAYLHIASTKDEFPAVITGKLRKSTGYIMRSATLFIETVGVAYAKFLNRRNKYLQKGINASFQKIPQLVKKHFKFKF